MRRDTGRRSRYYSGGGVRDPFAAHGATYAWRADDAIDDGANTTSLPSYIGSLTLTRDLAGVSVKAPSANFGGKVTLSGDGFGSGYSGAFTVSPAMSFVSVWDPADNATGVSAVTLAGALNTGCNVFYTNNQLYARKVVSDNIAVLSTVKMIVVSVFDVDGSTLYANSYTGTTQPIAGDLVGNTITLLGLSTAGSYALNGEWRTTAYFNRALTAAEAADLLGALGAEYGVTIAP